MKIVADKCAAFGSNAVVPRLYASAPDLLAQRDELLAALNGLMSQDCKVIRDCLVIGFGSEELAFEAMRKCGAAVSNAEPKA